MSLMRNNGFEFEDKKSDSHRALDRKTPNQPIRPNSLPLAWMFIGLGVGLALAAPVLIANGPFAKSLVMAIRLTARWAFLLFWLAYTGGAVSALFGPAFEALAGRGREFGLAYASALLVHLGLVVWLFQVSPRPPLTGKLLIFFIVGVVWTYLLSVFSVGGLTKALGSRGWRTLRVIGINYILVAFAFDFVPVAIHGIKNYGAWRLFQYAPFAAMSVAAPVLVLMAAAYRRPGLALVSTRGQNSPLSII
jgi:hypothetical protein